MIKSTILHNKIIFTVKDETALDANYRAPTQPFIMGEDWLGVTESPLVFALAHTETGNKVNVKKSLLDAFLVTTNVHVSINGRDAEEYVLLSCVATEAGEMLTLFHLETRTVWFVQVTNSDNPAVGFCIGSDFVNEDIFNMVVDGLRNHKSISVDMTELAEKLHARKEAEEKLKEKEKALKILEECERTIKRAEAKRAEALARLNKSEETEPSNFDEMDAGCLINLMLSLRNKSNG